GGASAGGGITPAQIRACGTGGTGWGERSRYCNFRCAFCALTGEGRRYASYPLDAIRRQVVAMGRRPHVLFIDNNFYGNDRRRFEERLALVRELREQGWFGSWAALVTGDFFQREANLARVREAGCAVLFSGVESFDTDWLRSANKLQNTTCPQVELIRRCLDAGVLFCYGLILDVTTRR